MKSSAILINVARGGIVDEVALANALNNDVIAGAAFDVFASEPINADSPLMQLKDPYKFIASPHNAWATVESIDNLIDHCYTNIREYISGKSKKDALSLLAQSVFFIRKEVIL